MTDSAPPTSVVSRGLGGVLERGTWLVASAYLVGISAERINAAFAQMPLAPAALLAPSAAIFGGSCLLLVGLLRWWFGEIAFAQQELDDLAKSRRGRRQRVRAAMHLAPPIATGFSCVGLLLTAMVGPALQLQAFWWQSFTFVFVSVILLGILFLERGPSRASLVPTKLVAGMLDVRERSEAQRLRAALTVTVFAGGVGIGLYPATVPAFGGGAGVPVFLTLKEDSSHSVEDTESVPLTLLGEHGEFLVLTDSAPLMFWPTTRLVPRSRVLRIDPRTRYVLTLFQPRPR